MKKTTLIFFVGLSVFLFFGIPSLYSAGSEESHGERGHGDGHHEAHHGGMLNVIGKERGHVEIRISGDTLEAWFVGGGHDTHRSVPIKAEEISLTVSLPGKGQAVLLLKAAPMKLAGEKIGRCSHFTAKADWLRDIREFEARGEVEFKGVKEMLLIKYPHGYDPMHGQ